MPLAVRYGTIVESVKNTRIPKNEIIVVGGAAMQLLGIKETRDIDVVVTNKWMLQVMCQLLERLPYVTQANVQKPGRLTVMGEGQRIAAESDEYSTTYGDIAYMQAPYDDLYSATFEELHDEAIEVEGILMSPAARILAWKQGVNRAKDQQDIALLQDYLAG